MSKQHNAVTVHVITTKCRYSTCQYNEMPSLYMSLQSMPSLYMLIKDNDVTVHVIKKMPSCTCHCNTMPSLYKTIQKSAVTLHVITK